MEVYRFRQSIAINPPEGPTFYLSWQEAGELSNAIVTIAADIIVGSDDYKSKEIETHREYKFD